MFSPYSLFAVVVGYMAILLLLGLWTEHRVRRGRDPTDNGLVYTLSLTVYCTSWTFYGSVGSAANSGMLYSAIYLGPTLAMLLAWSVVRRMIRLKNEFRLTSVADFLTARYGRSVLLAASVTVFLFIGMVPYVGLQIRAIITAFSLLTDMPHTAETISTGHYIDELLVALVAALTIVFGLRRLDPSERQHGLVAVLAVESVVKLVAFVAVGLFVTYGLFDGFAELLARIDRDPGLQRRWTELTDHGQWYMAWATYLLLSMSAILFLPRMFHVAVVENRREAHLRTSMWLFPLYLLAISLFVMPIAGGGLLLGHPVSAAETFVLLLPLVHGERWLALLSYLGGFSAAIGMIMVVGTTLAVMVANFLALPLIDRLPRLAGLRRRVRLIRAVAVVLIVWLGYLFEQGLLDAYLLIQMGLISFAATLQIAPAGLGALYWRGGSRAGAYWGISLGATVWAYTLFFPALVRSGLADPAVLAGGPFGIGWLRPEALFGLDAMPPLASAVFWSLLANLAGYLGGSLLRPPRGDEAVIAERFADILAAPKPEPRGGGEAVRIELAPRLEQIVATLARYMPEADARRIHDRLVADLKPLEQQFISGSDFIALSARAETALAGVIGSALARRAMREGIRLSEAETLALQGSYAQALAEMRISPEELRRRVDYFKSLQDVTTRHADELAEKLAALQREMTARELADAALRESEDRFRSLADDAPVLIWLVGVDPASNYVNRTFLAFTGRALEEEKGDGWTSGLHPEEREQVMSLIDAAFSARRGFRSEFRLRRRDGEYRWIRTLGIARFAGDGSYLGFIGTGLDITDLKAAEATLRRSKDELEARVDERTRELQDSLAEVTRVNHRLEDMQGQLLQSEKMASIGQLAAGVAHEINNPVGFVTSNLGSLQKYLADIFRLLDAGLEIAAGVADAEQRARLDAIRQDIDFDYLREDIGKLLDESRDGLERVRRIVKDLKDFSHVDEAEWQIADINAGLDSTLNVVWNELKYKAEVVRDYGALPEVECLPAQLNQVFMNLLINAAQAIPEHGTITVRTRHEDAAVCVEVEDTGKGIAPENLKKIFDPFFTTKPVGKGTGLGLSLAFGIMRKHRGRIEVDSTVGDGSCFRVWIPVRRIIEENAE